MTTALDVFNITMGLLDELNPDTGNPDNHDTKEYKLRTPHILNLLIGELYQFSDTYPRHKDGKRPIPAQISTLQDTIPLDEFIAKSILPLGLAFHLVIDENPSLAHFFRQRYQEMTIRYATNTPAVIEPIIDKYGGIPSL